MSRASLVAITSLLAAATISVACAASSGSTGSATPAVTPAANLATSPPSPDPRVGLKAGLRDAGEAAWNMRLVTNVPPSADVFAEQLNSDLAFTRNYAIQ